MMCDLETLKSLIENLIPKQSFWDSQTFGVIIGAVLTGGFTWLIEFIKIKREEKVYLKRKREETYLDALNLILNSAFTINQEEWVQELKSTTAKVALYLSSEEFNNFIELVQSAKTNKKIDESKVDEFVKHCKKQLKIKD